MDVADQPAPKAAMSGNRVAIRWPSAHDVVKERVGAAEAILVRVRRRLHPVWRGVPLGDHLPRRRNRKLIGATRRQRENTAEVPRRHRGGVDHEKASKRHSGGTWRTTHLLFPLVQPRYPGVRVGCPLAAAGHGAKTCDVLRLCACAIDDAAVDIERACGARCSARRSPARWQGGGLYAGGRVSRAIDHGGEHAEVKVLEHPAARL